MINPNWQEGDPEDERYIVVYEDEGYTGFLPVNLTIHPPNFVHQWGIENSQGQISIQSLPIDQSGVYKFLYHDGQMGPFALGYIPIRRYDSTTEDFDFSINIPEKLIELEPDQVITITRNKRKKTFTVYDDEADSDMDLEETDDQPLTQPVQQQQRTLLKLRDSNSNDTSYRNIGDFTIDVNIPIYDGYDQSNPLTINQNGSGVISIPQNYEGLGEIHYSVNVPQPPSLQLQSKTINYTIPFSPTTITPDSGYDGLSQVQFNCTSTITSSIYYPDQTLSLSDFDNTENEFNLNNGQYKLYYFNNLTKTKIANDPNSTRSDIVYLFDDNSSTSFWFSNINYYLVLEFKTPSIINGVLANNNLNDYNIYLYGSNDTLTWNTIINEKSSNYLKSNINQTIPYKYYAFSTPSGKYNYPDRWLNNVSSLKFVNSILDPIVTPFILETNKQINFDNTNFGSTIYVNPDTGYDGFRNLILNVPELQIQSNKQVNINENGTITVFSDSGYTSLGSVTITTNVPKTQIQDQTSTPSNSSNVNIITIPDTENGYNIEYKISQNDQSQTNIKTFDESMTLTDTGINTSGYSLIIVRKSGTSNNYTVFGSNDNGNTTNSLGSFQSTGISGFNVYGNSGQQSVWKTISIDDNGTVTERIGSGVSSCYKIAIASIDSEISDTTNDDIIELYDFLYKDFWNNIKDLNSGYNDINLLNKQYFKNICDTNNWYQAQNVRNGNYSYTVKCVIKGSPYSDSPVQETSFYTVGNDWGTVDPNAKGNLYFEFNGAKFTCTIISGECLAWIVRGHHY